MNIKIISAGAGSGKTYRLTNEMVDLLSGKGGVPVRASGIIATTFTKKAAAELRERVRIKLLEQGMVKASDELSNALIGTVHSMGVKLLKRFAFEAGVSPNVDIIADDDHQVLFNQSLSSILFPDLLQEMEAMSERLGLNKKDRFDWRLIVKQLVDVARANNFSSQQIEESKQKSIESLFEFLPEVSSKSPEKFNTELLASIHKTVGDIENNADSTKKTNGVVSYIRRLASRLELKGELNWFDWAKLSKTSVGKKSESDFELLKDFALTHTRNPLFHADIKHFITQLFDLANQAISEYQLYKKKKGLIDYTDMETLVLKLIDHPTVKSVLSKELDLLMVDEFQDTNPIQLEIFLKLSRIAKCSVWVGDPKQSIYGFRGAEPELMQAIVEAMGGVKPEDILANSWRSRADIVHTTNAIFCDAFKDMDNAQIALDPKRTKAIDPIQISDALMHWHFSMEDGGRSNKEWMMNCTAATIKQVLDKGHYIIPKGETKMRKLLPGDLAILCKTNAECMQLADALYRSGIKAAISRTGLLETAEAKLVLACLKYLLNKSDSLSVAEILFLADNQKIEEIIDHRLDYLDNKDRSNTIWANENMYIDQLNELRHVINELSGTEILNLILEELELRRIIAQWGNSSQRFDNIDQLRNLAVSYEETCNRLHTAASLGGLLLWLSDISNEGLDEQGSGEGMDAVNVLTYHKSKGLEWPLVVCYSLDAKLRNEVWGLSVQQENDTVDLDKPLAGRWLRYWVNPYNDQHRGTALATEIEGSPAKLAVHQKALKEEARLLYVGITRARDYLVFTTRDKQPPIWLNRVCQEGNEKAQTIIPGEMVSPWVWNETPIAIESQDLSFAKEFMLGDRPLERIQYYKPRFGVNQFDSAIPVFTDEENRTLIQLKKPVEFKYNSHIQLLEQANESVIFQALKSFYNTSYKQDQLKKQEEKLDLLLDRFDASEMVDKKSILQSTAAFWTYLNSNINFDKVIPYNPIRWGESKSYFEALSDLTLIGKDKTTVILHLSYLESGAKLLQRVKDSAIYFHNIKKGLPDNATLFLHFPFKGILWKIETEKVAQQLKML